MYSAVQNFRNDHEELDDVFNVTIEEDSLINIPGLKDVAFYYLILHMIQKQLLNRLYTHCLEGILQAVKEKYLVLKNTKVEAIEDLSRFGKALRLLSRYPVSSKPPGLCLIFHMDEGRSGAENDFKRVKELFEKHYGYDVFHKRNPKTKEIQDIATKLAAQRNKFYDR